MDNLSTTCVHPFENKSNETAAVTAAIHPAVAYNYLNGGTLRYPGFYSTYNQERLGQIICKLEKGAWGMVFSSGMAAISTAILSFLQAGDHIIFSKDLYGGTLRFAQEELPKRGIACSFAAGTVESFSSMVTSRTKIIYVETPSNPLMQVVPLAALASLARSQNILTIVDNTFASPINQQPLSHGFNISLHSGTKYLGGHNDLPYGALVCDDEQHRELIFNTAKMYGGSLTPDACYLAERSLKTLALRVTKQNDNAMQLAVFLEHHPAVAAVYYPGLPSHPQHQLAASQMTGFGGMVSFELKTDLDGIVAFQKRLRLISPALSLGGVESLVCSPVFTSHRYLSREQRLSIGIRDNLLRLSVGIEDARDLMADIGQAIDMG